MQNVIKTEYMGQPTKGYSEYIARDFASLQGISPITGDRAILLDGSVYVCLETGTWEKIGG